MIIWLVDICRCCVKCCTCCSVYDVCKVTHACLKNARHVKAGLDRSKSLYGYEMLYRDKQARRKSLQKLPERKVHQDFQAIIFILWCACISCPIVQTELGNGELEKFHNPAVQDLQCRFYTHPNHPDEWFRFDKFNTFKQKDTKFVKHGNSFSVYVCPCTSKCRAYVCLQFSACDNCLSRQWKIGCALRYWICDLN